MWNGGMLAVCTSRFTHVEITNSVHAGRDGVRRRFREPMKVATLISYLRMGKTIQMISLLLSDKGAKPNLVIAYV